MRFFFMLYTIKNYRFKTMTTPDPIHEIIENAYLKANQCAQLIHGRRVKTDTRSDVAAGCFAIAQQHHNSILILLKNNPPLYATAFSILRSLLEATIKGIWLFHTATDEEIKKFPVENLKKTVNTMIKEIGEQMGKKSSINTNYWKTLCSYTHTGESQIQHWINTNNLEAYYPEESLRELLKKTEQISSLLYSQIMTLTNEE